MTSMRDSRSGSSYQDTAKSITHLRSVHHAPEDKVDLQHGEKNDDVIGNEIVKDILEEAAEHPVSKGERPEWKDHVGVGRKERIQLSSPQLLSRSIEVNASCDTRGNLGPCSVVNQISPGSHWLKDRWQAASDMGGTAIPGHHWVVLDFPRPIFVNSAVVDWETAFATAYRIEGGNGEKWDVLYDGSLPESEQLPNQRTSHEYGQSPGVKEKMPLHVVHKINLSPVGKENNKPYTRVRLYVLRPARGWGVSLWQFDIYGHEVERSGAR